GNEGAAGKGIEEAVRQGGGVEQITEVEARHSNEESIVTGVALKEAEGVQATDTVMSEAQVTENTKKPCDNQEEITVSLNTVMVNQRKNVL
ncbi:uncharacterized, partial [Tachysurus ichikawai]